MDSVQLLFAAARKDMEARGMKSTSVITPDGGVYVIVTDCSKARARKLLAALAEGMAEEGDEVSGGFADDPFFDGAMRARCLQLDALEAMVDAGLTVVLGPHPLGAHARASIEGEVVAEGVATDAGAVLEGLARTMMKAIS